MIQNRLNIAGFIIGLLLLFPFVGSGVHSLGIHNQDNSSAELHTITVDVTLDDYEFKPQSIKVQAGHKVVLNFTNKGSVGHEFMAGKKVSDDTHAFKTDLFQNVEVKKSLKEEHQDEEMKEHAEEGHEEEMDEHGQEAEEHHGTMISLEPGQTGTMTFTLPSSKVGSWNIGCFEKTGSKKHYNLGMKGTLIVKPE